MKKRSITRKVLVVFLSVTTSIVLMTFLAAVTGGNYLIKDTITDYTYELVSQVDSTVIDYQNSMKHIVNAILETNEIQQYIYENDDNESSCVRVLDFAAATRGDITNIFAMRLNEEGSLDIISDDIFKEINKFANYAESPWYKEIFVDGEDIVLTSSYVQNLVMDRYNWVISLGMAVKDDEDKVIGIVLLDLNYSSIKNICDEVIPTDQGYVYLLSNDGQIVYHPQQQLIFNNVKEEDTTIIQSSLGTYIEQNNQTYIVSSSSSNEWKTVAVLENSILFRNTIINTVIFAATTIIFVLIAFYISYIFSRWFTKPIMELSRNMKKVQNGDLTVRVNIKNNDEIGDLGDSFNVMTERLDISRKRILIEQEEKRISELNALRAQINPHFLYNTLDSIIWMAECDQTEEVVDMTSALSKMLRASINRQKGDATLKLELQNAVNYLKIQKFRYSNKLDYKIDVDESLHNKKVVHLILQPLVENAIYHGIKANMGVGIITIRAYEEDNLLYIKVIDDGVGMDKKTVNDVFMSRESIDTGIGIYNVDRRIKLVFGEEYGLSIDSEPKRGTTITITIPSQSVETKGDDLY